MNRSLTAAVALAAAFGVAGMAHAQSSAGTSTVPNTLNSATPSTQMTPQMAPTTTVPAGTQHPAAMSSPSPTGMQAPQTNAQMNESSQPPSQSQIEQAQQQLKSQGLYRGAVDGIMGPGTETALSAFQREQGLPQTSQLDQQTLDRLNGGSSTGTAGMTSQPGTQRSSTMPGAQPSPMGATGMSPGTPATNR